MKINNKKIIVSTLALAMGAALAGSISGSVAWYQYSTRASAEFVGTTIGTLGKLELKIDNAGDWKDVQDISGDEFKPTTIERDTQLTFYDHPVYQVPQLPEVSSTELPYVDHTVDFQFQTSEDGTTWTDATDRNVYLSHFAIVKNDSAAQDVSGAVRVAFLDESENVLALFSKVAAGETTATEGNLDLNANGTDDTDFWKCDDSEGTAIDYTTGTASYATDAHSTKVLTEAEQANIYTLDTTVGAKKLCKVSETITVRIWLEGWALLGGKASWSKDYLEQDFNVQIQFMCQADK